MPYNFLSSLPIDEKLQWLFQRNVEFSELFCSPEEVLARAQYVAKHPILKIIFKCMDGRMHIPVITKTPLGILQPVRALGGRFDLGWPYLGQYVKNLVMAAIAKGNGTLVFVTYHFSKGDKHRGCAGFNYDLEAAFAYTKDFKSQVERVFGKKHAAVYPLIVGLETDSDSLIFHNNGDKIDLLDFIDKSEEEIFAAFKSLFSDMSKEMLNDLMPLVSGNIQHIIETQKSGRQIIDVEHREFVVGLGTGFDWLHAPNTALLIGPWSPWLDNDIRKAFSIIKSNMEAKRISDDGFVLMISSMWQDSTEKALVTEKVHFLKAFATDILNAEFPEIASKMHCLPVIVEGASRKFTKVEDSDSTHADSPHESAQHHTVSPSTDDEEA